MMRKSVVSTLAAPLVALTVALTAATASADVLDKIKERGKIVVGVKADYRPFGFRDPSGAIVGIEPDLAADVAKRLDVGLELVPVVSANRIEFLQQGKIDLVLATMSDKPERRKIVDAIDPPYYSDFANILMAKKAGITSWEELKGKPVCGTTAAYYNRDVATKYGANIIAFEGSEKPLFALRQGDCVGYLFDQTLVQGKLLDEEWRADFHMPLPGIQENPFIMAVGKGEDRLKQVMVDATLDWMKNGTIVALEKKWGFTPTEYSLRMHEKYKNP